MPPMPPTYATSTVSSRDRLHRKTSRSAGRARHAATPSSAKPPEAAPSSSTIPRRTRSRPPVHHAGHSARVAAVLRARRARSSVPSSRAAFKPSPVVNKLEIRAADTDDPSRDGRSLYESDDSLDASDLQSDDAADRSVSPLPQQEQTKGSPSKSPPTKGTPSSARTPQPAGAEQPLKQPQQTAETKEAAGGLDEIRRTFDKLDRNGDGIVNIREFIISIRKDPALGAWLGLGTLGGKGVQQEEGR